MTAGPRLTRKDFRSIRRPDRGHLLCRPCVVKYLPDLTQSKSVFSFLLILLMIGVFDGNHLSGTCFPDRRLPEKKQRLWRRADIHKDACSFRQGRPLPFRRARCDFRTGLKSKSISYPFKKPVSGQAPLFGYGLFAVSRIIELNSRYVSLRHQFGLQRRCIGTDAQASFSEITAMARPSPISTLAGRSG